MQKMAVVSCDTFVALPPLTSHGGIIFGKNSDRPQGEVQELVYFKPSSNPSGSKVMCTYIEVDQVESTHGVILSKPAWMWGAEMGANTAGVVIGNEAVYTKLESEEDINEKLLGMDLVRLGLERAGSANEAVTIISSLLEKYGQGGPCSDVIPSFTYHNSFLIADPSEAWVLETAGHLWAAEKITEGHRNISNCLSLTTKLDRSSANLKEYAKEKNLWNGEDEFNFSKIFTDPKKSTYDRLEKGTELLKKLTSDSQFKTNDMFLILRDKDSSICRSVGAKFPTQASQDVFNFKRIFSSGGSCSREKSGSKLMQGFKSDSFSETSMFKILRDIPSGICMTRDESFVSTGSQVSVLSPPGSGKPHVHWFTATPDPSVSVFKPFIFTPNVKISQHTISPIIDNDPAKEKPRFQRSVDRAHLLHKLHENAINNQKTNVLEELRKMETGCVNDIVNLLKDYDPKYLSEMDELLKDVVETEVKFYR